jgi:hypothetical protein
MVMAKKRIGILTGGGDVPGLNAVIKTVTYRSDPPVNVVSPQPRLSPTVGALLLSQKSVPFAPPALPGINAPTTLSDSRLGISGNLADVYIFRFDRDSLIFCTMASAYQVRPTRAEGDKISATSDQTSKTQGKHQSRDEAANEAASL